jgi:replicative DNA helicase
METETKSLLPHDLMAEMSVLGAMFFGGEKACDAAFELLGEDEFYRPAHRVIFGAMKALRDEGTPPDAITVREKLDRAGTLESIGGVAYLMQLGDIEFTTANLRHYARIVRAKSDLRRIILTASEIYRRAVAEDAVAETLLSRMEDTLAVCRDHSTEGSGEIWQLLPRLVSRHMDLLDARRLAGGALTGISTGLASVDRITNGLRASELVILAARPAMGKSACAGTIAINVAKSGGAVAFFSLEMDGISLVDRFVAAETQIDLKRILRGTLDDAEWRAVADAASCFHDLRLAVDESSYLSVGSLEGRCRALKSEWGKLDLVVVDYLQYLTGLDGKRYGTREQEVTEIARYLKRLARSMKCPVLALAQINRAVETRENKRPVLSDLRESGGVEAEADIVAFLYRASYYEAKSDPEFEQEHKPEWRDEVEFIIGKNRNGPTGFVKIGFAPKLTRFDDLAPEGML